MGEKHGQSDVCLVMPPVSGLNMPSLALGILKSCLVNAGISVHVDYANLFFAQLLGWGAFHRLYSGSMTDFIGEYIFCGPAGISKAPPDDVKEFLHILREVSSGKKLDPEFVRCACSVADKATKETVRRILEREPKIVGCSAVFQQRNASLAILRQIKELRPNIKTVMGGFTCFGAAGIAMLKEFPFLDYVFFGESDEIFASVCSGILRGEDRGLPYGVLRNGGPYPEIPPHRITHCMDGIPVPDYDEYFQFISSCPDFGGSPSEQDWSRHGIVLLLEASRGCWWGEKTPCTFCGLNGKIRTFRKKSPIKVVKEVSEITGKYHCRSIQFSDNVMPPDFFRELLPALQALQNERYSREDRICFTAEVKARMSKKQLIQMSQAGFRVIQPGIESLSDHILELMHKGVQAIENIALLKYAAQAGIAVMWNLLTGFPGEDMADYAQQADILPMLEHFSPPTGCYEIVYVRNSVYEQYSADYNLSLKPVPAFRQISPKNEVYVNDIAFNYTDENAFLNPFVKKEKQRLQAAAKKWLENFQRSEAQNLLEMSDRDGLLTITDLRECAVENEYQLTGLGRKLYLLAESPVRQEKLFQLAEDAEGKETVSDVLQMLTEKKLIVQMSGKILALAVFSKGLLHAEY